MLAMREISLTTSIKGLSQTLAVTVLSQNPGGFMFGINNHKIGWTALALSFVVTGCSTSLPAKEDVQSTLSDAEVTLSHFRNDPEMKWFRENFKNAKAILISPNILTVGFFVGGSTGKAVAMARDERGRWWAGPAFYRVSTGSIGFQAGAQAAEMVALVMTDKARNSLLSTSFKLGGDVSIAVGPIGAGTGAPVTADMVVFTRTKGLYGGINLDGTVITINDDDNRVFYGRPVTPVDILIKHIATSPSSAPLSRSLSAVSP